jgi:type III pantothenate kinase
VLLVIDVGNTQTVLGLYDGERLVDRRRVATEAHRTGDELFALLRGLVDVAAVDGVCLSSTVPVLVRAYEELSERWLRCPLLVTGPGTRTGMPIRFEDPREVGPDRIANAVAALARYGAPCIAVDFGTATNFDAISSQGEYVGGVLAPGVEVSMDALFERAARLHQIDFVEPERVIGKSTAGALQSGLVYGFAGQVDGIVEHMRGELGAQARVIATGGLASLVAPHSRTIELIDADLTLEGLRLIWERNRSA